MRELSLILNEVLWNTNVPLQLSPLDVTVMRDGRFNSFTPDFYNYFLSEGKVVAGPDYRLEMAGRIDVSTDAMSHNLRKVRQGLLFSEYNKQKDYLHFLQRFDSALKIVSTDSKQVLRLVDGEVRGYRFSALPELKDIFPSINIEPLERIKDLYENTQKLDDLYKNPEELIRVWYSSVTFLEEFIREYIREFPSQQRACFIKPTEKQATPLH